ncbi:hypothetical protein SK128_003198, partial [Halocaridina rubra]
MIATSDIDWVRLYVCACVFLVSVSVFFEVLENLTGFNSRSFSYDLFNLVLKRLHLIFSGSEYNTAENPPTP